MTEFRRPQRDFKYFLSMASTTIGFALSSLSAGGYMIWPTVTQYFHEIPQAVAKTTITPPEVFILGGCIGFPLLAVGLLYQGMRMIKPYKD